MHEILFALTSFLLILGIILGIYLLILLRDVQRILKESARLVREFRSELTPFLENLNASLRTMREILEGLESHFIFSSEALHFVRKILPVQGSSRFTKMILKGALWILLPKLVSRFLGREGGPRPRKGGESHGG